MRKISILYGFDTILLITAISGSISIVRQMLEVITGAAVMTQNAVPSFEKKEQTASSNPDLTRVLNLKNSYLSSAKTVSGQYAITDGNRTPFAYSATMQLNINTL